MRGKSQHQKTSKRPLHVLGLGPLDRSPSRRLDDLVMVKLDGDRHKSKDSNRESIVAVGEHSRRFMLSLTL
jgi:hypothetical protein